jgi:predicted HTH transcriptional regulator
MIEIRDEADLANWFRKNYDKLGFERILKDNKGRFPDFIVLENKKRLRVELEVLASNFILHKHSINKVDKVVCAFNDVKLKIPVIKINNVKMVSFDKKPKHSFEKQIFDLFNKEKIFTSSEISKILDINWNTADSYLKELLIEGKIERIKKEGVNLWMKK